MVSGASIVVKNLAENMVVRGHKVLVIAASDRGRSYKIINGNLTILRLRSLHNPLRVGQKFTLSLRFLIHSLRNFQPDLIHTHDALQLGVLCLTYKRTQKTPIVLTTHALPNFAAKYIPIIFSGFQPVMETFLWWYAWLILRQFDAVTTPTITTSSMISAITNIQPISISNGVDLDTFSPSHLTPDCETALRTQLNLPPKVPVILHVGRLDTDKRVDQVIRATARAIQNSDVHLLVVGDGCQKTRLMKLCESLEIEKRCHFLGYVLIEDGLPDIYRLANLFVTASEIETQGIVLLEAAASGLPIVAVRATCIPEIVHDGVNGYLTEPNDTLALGNAITDLLLNPDKAKQMGKAGHQLVQEHNILATFDSYENMYFDLVRQRVFQPAPKKVKVHKWQERAKEWLNL